MKKLIFILLSILALGSCGTLNSTTYIEPSRAFVLGEGTHGPLNAKVQNVGTDAVQVTLTTSEGAKVDLGVLNVNETKTYSIPSNCFVSFQNTSDSNTSTIRIKAKGDVNVGMRYQ
ncbi:MAG: hypothetical protein ACOYLH_09120 [Flavobacteriales bacterium]